MLDVSRDLFDRHLAVLIGSDDAEPSSSLLAGAAVLVLHLVGLAAIWRYYQQPVWLALPTLALLLVVPIVVSRSRGAWAIETLAPLFFLYAILAARFVFVRGINGTVPGYFDYNTPDLNSTLFRIEPWTLCALFYTLAIQVRYLAARVWQRVVIGAAMVFALAAFVWGGTVYVGQRTRGVTGSDPYAYVQMAVDLATRNTPLHQFTLFPSVVPLGVAWSPIVHTGYHIPINASGDASTVWPIGGSFAMAVAYRLIGETGIYLVNPVMSLLLLAATGWLAWELVRDRSLNTCAWVAALSLAILATSHTLFDWATVPMVDAQAALFSTLAIVSALRYSRQPRAVWAVLSGIALGMAYFIRHTQLLIAPAILLLLWMNDQPRAARWRALVIAGASALLVSLPDLWYHQAVFGGIFNVESTEQNLFSLSSWVTTGGTIIDQLVAAREFGWLVPFTLYGAYRLARANRVAFLALFTWVIVPIAFQLLYPALRLRDLLPEFPPLVVFTSYGVVAFIAALWNAKRNAVRFAAACGVLVTLFLLVIRVWNVLPQPFSAPQPSFGYVTAAQRVAFDQIAALTPARAVIGSSLNTGPIEWYGKRETFHPAMWTPAERDVFIAAMLREGRTVFLLDDGTDADAAQRDLETRYSLRQVAVFDVPLFGAFDGTPGALYEILEK